MMGCSRWQRAIPAAIAGLYLLGGRAVDPLPTEYRFKHDILLRKLALALRPPVGTPNRGHGKNNPGGKCLRKCLETPPFPGIHPLSWGTEQGRPREGSFPRPPPAELDGVARTFAGGT